MHTLTAPMQAHLAGSETTLALCAKGKRTDGLAFGFTEHDADLIIDLDAMGYTDGDGAVIYSAAKGLRREAFEQRSNMRVPNLDIIGVLTSGGVTRDDLMGGKWDLAEFKIFFANWQDTSAAMGIVPLQIAYLDEVVVRENGYQATLRDIIERYNLTKWISLYTVKCRNILGSTTGQWRCGVQVDPPAWTAAANASIRPPRDARAPLTGVNVVKPTTFTGFHYKATTAGTTGGVEPVWPTTLGGTVDDNGVIWEAILALTMEGSLVDAVIDNRQFGIDYAGPVPDQFYRGRINWLTGLNAGTSKEVKSFFNGALNTPPTLSSVELYEPMPFDVQIGDSFTMTAFCSKVVEDPAGCVARFDNVYNMAAEYLSPTADDIFPAKI